MKINCLLFLLFILAFSTFSLAQTIVIKPKKVVYTRTGKQIESERKTFNVTYPIVSGALSAQSKKTLENTISYWKTFETTLKENLGDYFWLTDLYYKVNYNKSGILDISLTQEGIGAYPSEQTVNLVIDLKTGKQIKFTDAFNQNSLNELAKIVEPKLEKEKAEIIKSIKDNKYDNAETDQDKKNDEQMLSDLKFTTENFNEYSVKDKGVTIFYDAGFPHVSQALQPEGRYFFTWAQVKPFIKPDGLLGKFVR